MRADTFCPWERRPNQRAYPGRSAILVDGVEYSIPLRTVKVSIGGADSCESGAKAGHGGSCGCPRAAT